MNRDSTTEEVSSGRQLFNAMKLAETGRPDDVLAYGFQLLENLLLEKAEEKFRLVLEQEPENAEALIGLALTLERCMEVEDAYDLFKKSLQIQHSSEAEEGLARVDSLMCGRNWREFEAKRVKFRRQNQWNEYKNITPEEQSRRIAEILASNA